MSTLKDLGFNSDKLQKLHELIGKFEKLSEAAPSESTSTASNALSSGLKDLKIMTNYKSPSAVNDEDLTVDLNDKSSDTFIDNVELHIKGGPLAESTRIFKAKSDSEDNENIIPSSIPTELPPPKFKSQRASQTSKRKLQEQEQPKAIENASETSQCSESLLMPEKRKRGTRISQSSSSDKIEPNR